MSLKLDNTQATVVKNITDYVINHVIIDAKNGKITLMYEALSDGESVSLETLHIENTSAFLNIKEDMYEVLKAHLEVTGTVE